MKKNIKKLIKMTLLVVFVSIQLLSVYSCGKEPAIISKGGNSPFIIKEIKRYSDSHNEYISDEGRDIWLPNNPVLILPNDIGYEVGDTIKIDLFEEKWTDNEQASATCNHVRCTQYYTT